MFRKAAPGGLVCKPGACTGFAKLQKYNGKEGQQRRLSPAGRSLPSSSSPAAPLTCRLPQMHTCRQTGAPWSQAGAQPAVEVKSCPQNEGTGGNANSQVLLTGA